MSGEQTPTEGEEVVVPYLPSVGMMRSWLGHRLAGKSEGEAWRVATTGLKPRELARREVAGARGQCAVLLTIPIEGGSSVVKRGHPERWRLSDHGRWRQMHLGAIEAAYGATPYFEHFYPAIYEALTSAEAGMRFAEFTRGLHRAVMEGALPERVIEYLRGAFEEEKRGIMRIADEKKGSGYADLAFVDVIFKKGPESLFWLITPG